jgi:hypothetical protein
MLKVNNNDWIHVSDRLPEEHETTFAKFKGTAKWDKNMLEKTTDTVLCTVKFHNAVKVITGRLNDGKWVLDFCNWIENFEVIAWMPFPKPYTEKVKDEV